MLIALHRPVVCRKATASEPPPAVSEITLLGVRNGAKVFIDGTHIATIPHAGPVLVTPGHHHLRLTQLGYAPFEQQIQVLSGRVLTIEVEMLPIAGVLLLRSDPPNAAVYVDDQNIAQTPCELELQTGPHTIAVKLEGYYPETFSLPISSGTLADRTVRLIPLPYDVNPKRPVRLQVHPWYTRWWVWPLIIGGTAALTVAIVVPVVYATRNDCDKLGAEVCFPIMVQMTPNALQLNLGR